MPLYDSTIRIPPELFEAYLRYKQDTRVVLDWLCHQDSASKSKDGRIFMDDLVVLASTLKTKGVRIPETIAFQFKEAIRGRRLLSAWFREQRRLQRGEENYDRLARMSDEDSTVGAVTESHEWFTDRLYEVYDILHESPSRDVRRDSGHDMDVTPPRAINTLNRFAGLSAAKSTEVDDQDEDQGSVQSYQQTTSQSRQFLRRRATLSLADDDLSTCIELKAFIQDIEVVLRTAHDIWERTSARHAPMVVAALLQSTAFEELKVIEQRLTLAYDFGDDLDGLSSRLVEAGCCCVDSSDHIGGGSPTLQCLPDWLQSVLNIGSTLRDMKVAGPAGCTDAMSAGVGSNSFVRLRQGPGSLCVDGECLRVLLQNILQHLTDKSFTHTFHACQVAVAVHDYLAGARANSGLHASLGMWLLLDSYKSYLFSSPEPRPSPSACRLMTLKFAQRAIPHIESVLNDPTMPCRCPETLAAKLENLQTRLEGFVKAKCFDLYFQSPWVSGGHMLSILEALFDQGLRLLTYRNYVGSVVHIYNALWEGTRMPSIPVLERLIEAFQPLFFSAGRPICNFQNTFSRFRGGRLRFRPQSSERGRQPCRMQVPMHTIKSTAGFGCREETKDTRLEYRKLSALFEIKEKGYRLSEADWSRVLKQVSPSQPSKPKVNCCDHVDCAAPLADTSGGPTEHRLNRLASIITEQSFSGDLSLARTNLFAIYLSCANVTNKLAQKLHDEPPEKAGQYCLCYTESLLAAVDRFREGQTMGCKGLAQACREAIEDEFVNKRCQDFTWEGI